MVHSRTVVLARRVRALAAVAVVALVATACVGGGSSGGSVGVGVGVGVGSAFGLAAAGSDLRRGGGFHSWNFTRRR